MFSGVPKVLQANIRAISSFKSPMSLSNLYPTSSLSFTAPVKVPDNGSKFSGFIPMDQLDITYARSSGPGGQNVNKVSTKVDVRFHVHSATWLTDDVKKNVLEKCKNKINKDGYLVVRSDKTRSQILNQADAVTLLREMIRRAAACDPPPPSEEMVHRLRKRMEKANRERLIEKREHSLKKESRRAPEINL